MKLVGGQENFKLDGCPFVVLGMNEIFGVQGAWEIVINIYMFEKNIHFCTLLS